MCVLLLFCSSQSVRQLVGEQELANNADTAANIVTSFHAFLKLGPRNCESCNPESKDPLQKRAFRFA